MIGDSEATGDGDMQPEVEVGGDKSLFMRQTDPFKPDPKTRQNWCRRLTQTKKANHNADHRVR